MMDLYKYNAQSNFYFDNKIRICIMLLLFIIQK